MLSVIRVTCSSVDSSLLPAGLTASVLHAHRHCQHTRKRKCTINKAVMKNISKEFFINKQTHAHTKEHGSTFEHPLP